MKEAAAPRPAGKQSSAAVARLATLQTVEKDHGRLETKTYYQSAVLDWFADRGRWEVLRTIGLVEAEREVGGKKTAERRNYLSGLQMGVTAFARAVSGHWSVENSLHWLPEVQTGEDDSRAWAGHPAENLATLRRVALSLLKREATKKRGIRGKQLNHGCDHAYLLPLLGDPHLDASALLRYLL